MPSSSWQRILGAIIYLLPWCDSLAFGTQLFIDFPFFQWLVIPALPIIFIRRGIPFGGLLLFLGLFIGVVRNQQIPGFIRFNVLQALLLDIAITLINYAFELFVKPLGIDLISKTLSSTVFMALLAIIIFSMVENIKGNEPDLPWISEAVKMQL